MTENEEEHSNERKCTDIFWLCLYILFWCLMVVIAAFSFVYGNPIRLINGYDSFGNICGSPYNKKMGNSELSGLNTSDRPYLLFYNMSDPRHSMQICVKECPKRYLKDFKELTNYNRETGVNLCKYNFDFESIKSKTQRETQLLSGVYGPCPVLPVYDSKPVLNRCVPKAVHDITDAVLNNIYGILNENDTFEKILGDLYSTWKVILGLTLLSLGLSLFVISILHLIARLVSYIILILFTVTSIGGTAFLWYTYFDIRNNLDKTNKNTLLWESVSNERAFLWYSIVATVITVIILLIAVILRKQVGFLANLFKETSKCMVHLPGLFFQPLLTFVILVLFFIFWIFVVLCLATSYSPTTSGMSSSVSEDSAIISPTHSNNVNYESDRNLSLVELIKKFTVVEYIDPIWVKYMWWVYFVGLIWTAEFIMACQQMVIAGAVAHWFYRHKYKDNSHVSYAICKLIKYHLGSVALGSLIITIVKIPRLILMFIHERLKRNKDKGSECASCALKCCVCCFYCLEKFLRYLNHNAYTVIAIDGVGFCKAAGTAFEVLASHALQVATINGIGDFILFLGKCFVTAVTGSVGLHLFKKNDELTFYAIPTLIVCIFAFFVAHCILSLYEMVVDTVYLCMCQSGESPDGIQMEHMGVTAVNNGNSAANPELEPIR